jgi:Sulfotransferase family
VFPSDRTRERFDRHLNGDQEPAMSDHVEPTPFVFVLGTGRCGSTILQELLARHEDVGFVSNVDAFLASLDLKGRWNNPLYRRVPSPFASRDVGYLRHLRYTLRERVHFGPSEAYRLLGRSVSPIVVSPFRDLTEDDLTPWLERRLRSFFEARRRAQRRPVFLHKLTGWPRARFLFRAFPEARFVHVVRDGRAVASSLMQRPWWKGHLGPEGWGFGPLPAPYQDVWESSQRSLVVLAGLEWRVLMDAFAEARSVVPADRWTEVRYEDFVRDARGEIDRVLGSIGLPWNNAFERVVEEQVFTEGRADAYLRDLRPEQVALLEDAIREPLEAFGYPLSRTTVVAAPVLGDGPPPVVPT